MKPGDVVRVLPSLYWGHDRWTGREMLVCGFSSDGHDAVLAEVHGGLPRKCDGDVYVNTRMCEMVRESAPEVALLAAWAAYADRLPRVWPRERPAAWQRRKDERRARELLAGGDGEFDVADLVYLTGLTEKQLSKATVPGRVEYVGERGERHVRFVACAELRAWVSERGWARKSKRASRAA